MRPAAPLRHGLPQLPHEVIGREQEAASLAALLLREEVRLVTLTGPPGVGKTRLAIETATGLGGHFPDGIAFVDLAPIVEPALVSHRIIQALGLPESAGRDLTKQLARALAVKRLLLILDNFEQVIAAAREVSHLLGACPGVKILVTSREPMHLSWEHQMPVPPLPLPDRTAERPIEAVAANPAVALFVTRAQGVHSGFRLTEENRNAVAEICRRLDGLPLAIELAAARIKYLAPEEILERELQPRLMDLGSAVIDRPARHASLQAAIEWSYHLLSPRERVVFRRFAVFAGGATMEAIGAVCNADRQLGEDTRSLVESLVDKSLFVPRPGAAGTSRFSMLEIVREFAHQQLATSGETELLQGHHLHYVMELAETGEPYIYGPQAGLWTDRLEAELDNVRKALQWGLRTPERGDQSARLVVAFLPFWSQQANWSEAQTWLEAVHPLTEDGSALRGKVLDGLGNLSVIRGDLGAAGRLLAEALSVFETLGDQRLQGLAHFHLGIAAFAQSRHAEAHDHFSRSLALARAAKAPVEEAWAINRLGAIELERENYEGARALLEQSLAACRAVGNPAGIVHTLNMLGEVARAQGDYARARRFYEESLAANTYPRSRRLYVAALGNLGYTYAHLGLRARARAAFTEALAVTMELSNPRAELAAFVGLAFIQPDPARLTRLISFDEHVRNPWSFTRADRREIDQALARARNALGEARFRDAWERGAAMTLEEARRDALAPFQGRMTASRGGPRSTRLSRREEGVAALVAQGLTNREIAAELGIGERTAEYHVQGVLNKLGFNSRAQIAAWAVAHGLAGDRTT